MNNSLMMLRKEEKGVEWFQRWRVMIRKISSSCTPGTSASPSSSFPNISLKNVHTKFPSENTDLPNWRSTFPNTPSSIASRRNAATRRLTSINEGPVCWGWPGAAEASPAEREEEEAEEADEEKDFPRVRTPSPLFSSPPSSFTFLAQSSREHIAAPRPWSSR